MRAQKDNMVFFSSKSCILFFGKLEQYLRASTENDSVISLKVHSICVEERSNLFSDPQNLSFSLDPNVFFLQFDLKKFGTDLKSANYVWKGTTWYFSLEETFFPSCTSSGKLSDSERNSRTKIYIRHLLSAKVILVLYS